MERASARSFRTGFCKGGLKPALLFWSLALALLLGAQAQTVVVHTPVLRWREDVAPVCVEATGVSPTLGATLVVYAMPAGAVPDPRAATITGSPALPAMAGSVTWLDGRMRFTPDYPLTRGVRYRAEVRVPGAAPVVSVFALPPDTTPPTTVVTQVFPSGEVLPENQLKFYVEFSAPMSRGGVYEHIHVRDAAGKVIDLAFLELDEELWDTTMTRLTLLIDPGRIKRGVKPLEDVGPVFETGKSYALAVDALLRDAAGRPLRTGFVKAYRVAAADRAPPDPKRWTIRAPAAGTREPLVLSFDEPMDRALALRLVRVQPGVFGAVKDAAKDAMVPPFEGEATLGSAEREWRFVPAQPWRAGPYHFTIGTTIEDLAGNNVGKLFDVDVFTDVSRRIVQPSVSLAFEVK